MEILNKSNSYLFSIAILYMYMTCLKTVPILAAIIHVKNLATDQSALLVFKSHITSDPSGILSKNWSATPSENSVCSWIGVTCGVRHQRVVSLDLSNMGLEGTIPPSLGNLSFLRSLNLSTNKFHGHLPNALFHLRRLQHIDFKNNSFSGTIPPSLGNVSMLETLRFTYNFLEGGIPEEIGNLQRLRVLQMEVNKLSGSIPFSLFNISTLRVVSLTSNNLSGYLPSGLCAPALELEILWLPKNRFSGPIPSSLCKCSKLQRLSLQDNNFTGRVPREIGNLTLLTDLYLGGNNLGGIIPESVGNLYKLERLVMDYCSLKATIPSAIFNISTMMTISAVGNELTGTLPSNLGHRLLYLKELYLGLNNLTGILSEYISNASSLVRLDLTINEFTGAIPSSLGDLQNLKYLSLESNNFVSTDLSIVSSLTNCRQLSILQIGKNPLNGRLPASLGNFSTSLTRFNAHDCVITGEIPNGVGNLSGLIGLHLAKNQISGFIPEGVKELSNLQILSLTDNMLSGSIPNDVCYLQNMYGLSLRGNRLSGQVPSCFDNLTSMKFLFLDSNMFSSSLPKSIWNLKNLLHLELSSNSLTGKIPQEIGNLKVVVDINMSYNYFTGDIPSTIGGVQSIISLSLAHNRFQGSIPTSFGHMVDLQVLDLSHNNLSGSIPLSLEKLKYLSTFNVSHNSLTGEIPVGGNFTNFTSQSFMSNKGLCGPPKFQVPPCKKRSIRHSRKTKIAFLRYFIPGFVLLFLSLCIVYLLVRWRNRRRKVQVKTEVLPPVAGLKRIEYRELFEATEGFVERNLLGNGSFGSVYKGVLSNGMVVAIKVFKLPLERASKSFDTECEILRNIRHRNLVKVITSCTNIEFRALILEYMPNGSLEKWLYSENCSLDVLQKLRIMIDVATALDYLHHRQSETPVVHLDLKPSNVLLDEDMVGHLSDFGISKLLSGAELKVRTETLGTIGYVAPEVGLEGLVSTSSDVYSYGIMLMETFTLMKPTDEMFSGDMNLRHWVNESDAVTMAMDVNFLRREEADHDCIMSVLQLALECSVESPDERLIMNDVLLALEKIRMKYFGSS